MLEAPRRPDEAERARAVHELGLLDTPPEDRFDRITRAAARLLDVPVSTISLVVDERHFNKSRAGEWPPELPRALSLCDHVVARDRPLVVEDLVADARFADIGPGAYAGHPVHDPSGRPLGALCVIDRDARDFTEEQRHALAALAEWAEAEIRVTATAAVRDSARAGQQLLRTVLDDAPAGVLLVGPSGAVLWANKPAEVLFDRPLSGQTDVTLSALLPTLVTGELDGGRRRDDRGGAARTSLQSGRRADGTRFPAEVTVTATQGAGSGPAAGASRVVFVRDLLDELSDSAQLAALRERTEVVLDALGEGVVVVEGDGTVSFGNLAFARLVGRRRADLPGQTWHELLHAGRCEPPACELRDPLGLVGRRLSGVELRRFDGSSVPVELSVRLVRDGDAGAGVVVTVADLTERLRVDRLKDEFLSSVSHELRTPLTSLRGSLGLLSAGVVDPATDRGRRMLTVAAESTERLGRLVNDILDLERLNAGRVQLSIAPLRVDRLMNAAVHAVSGAAAAAGVRVDVRDSDLEVLADSDRAVQVLVNLLGNAVKFSPPDSTVELAAEAEDERVHLSVTDRGRGIPPEQLTWIFERFAQVDASDARKQSGTGLGLAIAKGLAEQHGGSLRATSTLGEGSTFVFTLPAAPRRSRLLVYSPADDVPEDVAGLLARHGWDVDARQPDALGGEDGRRPGALLLADAPGPERVAALDAAARRGLPLLALAGPLEREQGALEVTGRVLVVEDDDALAEVLVAGLRAEGLQADQARTQSDAVAALTGAHPDVLVLDLVLAGGDGFGLVDELRVRGTAARCPVLVYSGLDLQEHDRSRLQTGTTSFLHKGWAAPEDVVAGVLRLLRSRTRDEEERP